MTTTYIGNIYCSDGKHMLTAVDGGGLGGSNDAGVALHTDATKVSIWETFKLILQPGSPPIGPGMVFALQTSSGINYLTAINEGGVGGPNNATCPIHTDQTTPGLWEKFSLIVDNTTNPPTVTIQTPNGINYLTAVNGGGVNGGNSQPIHSDATSVGTWERFTFHSS
jgi:hypothetical protein